MVDRVVLQEAATPAQHSGEASTLIVASQAAERIRVQELLRYFQPPDPTLENGTPRVALDTSLTAYAQLSALKLNCQRAFISLIDHEKQYIIAEATRSVSLETGASHGGDDDALYLGAITLDISFGVCPNTISVFTSADNSQHIAAPYVKATQAYYVMNDLSKISGFECRPYVAGWPHMRYYAEVPIHSPTGLTIGSLCVVDNKPREGLDITGIDALREISHAVMDHLELVMNKVQRRRAERMIQGLGLFVDGSESLRDWWMESEKASPSLNPSTRRLTISEQADKEFGPQRSSKAYVRAPKLDNSGCEVDLGENDVIVPFDVGEVLGRRLSHVSVESQKPHGPNSPGSPTVDSATKSPESSVLDINHAVDRSTNTTMNDLTENGSSRDSQSSTKSAPLPKGPVQNEARSDHEEMLSRATNLIREAVGLDGVIFLDPRLGNGRYNTPDHGHTVKEVGRPSRPTLEPPIGLHSYVKIIPEQAGLLDELVTPPRVQLCNVLACSTRNDSSLGVNSCGLLTFPEETLHGIIRNFPQGCVLKYDIDGLVSTNPLELAWYKRVLKAQEDIKAAQWRQNCSSTSNIGGLTGARELRHILPDVRSVILFPLWDSSGEKLLAYNIAWTIDPNRTFEREDFAYLASFGNSIVAELSRLDTIAADRAKADFISSISHELRSPLHGILASAELLKGLTKDSASTDILNTIESCGSTLLDTMENLLTFTKINNLSITKQQKTPVAKSSVPSLGSLTSEVDLGLLVEEVMNTQISGHKFLTTLETHSSPTDTRESVILDSNESADGVSIICDIEFQQNWFFNTQPGAWKRIVMNLVGNSLKYTDVGFIHVKLSQDEDAVIANGSSITSVCLTVEDSGKGISDDYLKHRLFKPFQQEDPLRPGTGLGLSIVNQLVQSINGTIEITSEIGSGTKVTITAMLEPLSYPIETPSKPIMSHEVFSLLAGRKVGFMGLDIYPDIRENPTGILSRQIKQGLLIKSSLAQSIRNQFGMDVVTVGSNGAEVSEVDIIVTREAHFRNTSYPASQTNVVPLIVLSAKLTLDYRPVSRVNGAVVYLSQPFGPHLVARALESCLPFLRASTVNQHGLNGASENLTTHIAPTTTSAGLAQDLKESPLTPDYTMYPSLTSHDRQRGGPQVLLVEDNPINLKLLVTYMKNLGRPYVTATNGLEAVKAYQAANGKFDIIFMDIQMPYMDGMSASSEIRKFEQQNHLNRSVIVALTGLASTDAQEQAVLSGIDLFLTKPVPLRNLKALIDEHFPAADEVR